MAAQLARWALRLLGPCRLRSCPALSFETLVTFLWYDVVTGGGSRTVGWQGPLPRVATLSLPAASFLLRLAEPRSKDIVAKITYAYSARGLLTSLLLVDCHYPRYRTGRGHCPGERGLGRP